VLSSLEREKRWIQAASKKRTLIEGSRKLEDRESYCLSFLGGWEVPEEKKKRF